MPVMTIHRLWRALGALMLVCLFPCLAAAGALSAQNREDVEKAETYLNDVTTLKARFLQVAPSGDTSEGSITMSRPGRLRLEYDPPSPILVIADGSSLIYFDKQLKQTSYLGLDSSPAGILVKKNVRLDGDGLKVTGVSHGPGVLSISLVKPDDNDLGRLTLVFSEQPFALKQWKVTDPQGQVTTVSLFAAERNVQVNDDLFDFRDPKFFGPPANQN